VKPSTPEPLLVPKARACIELGGISFSKFRRLVNAGVIHPVYLNKNSTTGRKGMVYVRTSEIKAIVGEPTTASAATDAQPENA
jgi:hypothetical protein